MLLGTQIPTIQMNYLAQERAVVSQFYSFYVDMSSCVFSWMGR
jgi:hypothetical protein